MAVFAFEQWMMASNTFLVNSFAKKGLKPKWQMVKFCRKPNCSISLSPDRLQYLQLSTFLTKISNATKIAYLSKAHICLQLPRSHGMIFSTVITTNHLNANYSQ